MPGSSEVRPKSTHSSFEYALSLPAQFEKSAALAHRKVRHYIGRNALISAVRTSVDASPLRESLARTRRPRNRRARRGKVGPVALGDHVRLLVPALDEEQEAPRWPPDAFAITATILKQAAAYSSVIETWPPRGQKEWTKFITRIGATWRTVATGTDPLPNEVNRWWRLIRAATAVPIESVCRDGALCQALLELNAAADEASWGIGIRDTPPDAFGMRALSLLVRNGFRSFCERVHPSRAVVLAKLHTPRSGLTLRSLSHHLALCSPTEVHPEWLLDAA
jgi:hypothetical protein